jgi:CBS domain-containing protein
MIEKNIVGTYSREEAYPVFQHEAKDEPAIKPVGSLSTVARVASINGIIGQVDPIDQWRAFSERLRERRLAQEARSAETPEAQSRPAALSPEARRAASQARKAYRDQHFQRTYEQDMVNIEHDTDPMVLGLQRYLALVNDPIPDEHLKAYETPADDEAPGADDACGLHTLQVKDVMQRKVVCVLESTTIEQVASICNRRGISGVPVVNANKALIGIVTLSDIIHQMFSKRSVSTYADQGGKVLEQKALAILDEPVRHYMKKNVITVQPETSVREACEVMMQHNIRRVVVARGDLVRGIFSAQDAVKVLAAAHLNLAD